MFTSITLVHDAIRSLLRDRSFSLLALLYLALGIGGNATMFGILSNVLLTPLPFPEPERLVVIFDRYTSEDGTVQDFGVSQVNFFAQRGQSHSFAEMAALAPQSFNLLAAGADPVRVTGVAVSTGLSDLLSISPFLGRGFTTGEDRLEGADVTVISHGFWKRHLGGRSDVLGETLVLDGHPHEIVGVLPRGLDIPLVKGEIWVPLRLDPGDTSLSRRRLHNLTVIGRLRPGATLQAARSEIEVISRRLAGYYPDTHERWEGHVVRLQDLLVDRLELRLVALQLAAGFVLLIVCLNLANLLLVRGQRLRAQTGIHIALGASRGHLLLRSVSVGVILSLAAGVLGTALAAVAGPTLAAVSPLGAVYSPFAEGTGGWRMIAFAVGLALAIGLGLGALTAWQALRISPRHLVGDDRPASGGRRRTNLLSALVVLEVGGAVVLLVGAGLMLKSLYQLDRVDAGFDPDRSLVLRMSLPEKTFPGEGARIGFVRRAGDRLEQIQSVDSYGFSTGLPLDSAPRFGTFTVEGRAPTSANETLYARYYLVTPLYFAAMGIELLAGRPFTAADDAAATPVAIVSRSMADAYWPERDPLGRRFKRGPTDSNRPWMTVVGIVEDVRDAGIDLPRQPAYYLPYPQHADTDPAATLNLVVRAEGDPLALSSPVRRAIQKVAPDLPVFGVRPLDRVVDESLGHHRFSAQLLSLFASFALLVTILGLYGVTASFVADRRKEIGVRMALGSSAGQIRLLVLRRGLALALGGLLLGLTGAWGFARFLSSQLFEVGALDPLVLALVAIGIAAVATVANVIPAWRAARVPPAVVLDQG